MDLLEQLKALLGNDWSTENIRRVLPQINALGIHVQNEARGDFRPRFLFPDGNTWDYGPEGWVGRGNIGDWHTNQGADPGTPPGGDPGAPPSGDGGGGYIGDGSGGGGGYVPGADPNDPFGMQSYLRSTPGYQFAFDQGQRAVQTSAAARGTLLTGGTLKALAKFGTGLADQTYDEATKRFLSLADLGARTATSPF